MSKRPKQVSLFFEAAQSFSTWPLHLCHHSFETFCWAVHQPADVHTSTFPQILFPKSATTLGLVEQAFQSVPLFTE